MQNHLAAVPIVEQESHLEPSLLVGQSEAMQRLRSLVARVARSQRPVLVTGPTGSGKELVVREVHRQSSRADAPLLDLNCAAIPESLMEAELFGHERGAFTGADRRREGFLTAVGNGTLFLDELAELSPPLQARLLRVIETRTYRRVGSVRTEEFRGRIVAATHADLEENVRQGRFREDLMYRLNVLVVRVPALDERREDIPALVRHFCRSQPRELVFSDEALRVLVSAPWPGNVRQLRNAIDKLAVLADDGPVTAGVLRDILGLCSPPTTTIQPLHALAASILRLDVEDKLAAIRNALVIEAMRQSRGNKAQAARLLGVHRKVVERRLSEPPGLDLAVDDSSRFRPAAAADSDP